MAAERGFDPSQVDPETYFQQALMGMSVPDVSSFALTTCRPLCKCTLCESLNKSSRSFAASTSSTCDDSEDSRLGDDVLVTMRGYNEEDGTRLDLPMSLELQGMTGGFTTYTWAQQVQSNTKTQQTRRQQQPIERKSTPLKECDRKKFRKKFRLKVLRDNQTKQAQAGQRDRGVFLERIQETKEAHSCS